MSKVKYIPVEIDGVEQVQPIELLLQDRDVDVSASGYDSDNLNEVLTQIRTELDNLIIGATDFDLVLTTQFGGRVLTDHNGNLLVRGF